MSYKLSNRSLDRLKGIKPILIEILKEGIKESPYDFGIPQNGGLRTAEDQHLLYIKKVSKCDGYKNKSYHQSGNAFDIYGYDNGKAHWDIDKLASIARHLQEVAKVKFSVDLKWGGDWKSWKDYPHFEIK